MNEISVGHLDSVSSLRSRDVVNDNSRQKIACFNYKKTGHTHRECENRKERLFCYWCGKDFVTVKDCPNCEDRYQQKLNFSSQSQFSGNVNAGGFSGGANLRPQ